MGDFCFGCCWILGLKKCDCVCLLFIFIFGMFVGVIFGLLGLGVIEGLGIVGGGFLFLLCFGFEVFS